MPLHQRTQNFTDRRSRTPGTVMVKGRRCQDGDVAVTCVINHHFWTIASSMTRWQNLRNFDYLAAREGLVLIMVLTQMISAKFWTERKKLWSSWTQNWSTYTVCTLFFIFDDFDDSLSSTSSFWYQENQSKNLALLSGLLFKLWKHDLVLWSTSSCFALLTALTNQFLLNKLI